MPHVRVDYLPVFVQVDDSLYRCMDLSVYRQMEHLWPVVRYISPMMVIFHSIKGQDSLCASVERRSTPASC